MAYQIGKFRGHTLWWIQDSNIPNDDMDEDMYVYRHDYSVWYKGRQVGYMKSDKSCIEPFYERVYKDLKLKKKKEEVKEKVKEVAESIPTSFLLDAGSEVEAMLKSVKDYCGAAVLGDEVFADLAKELEVLTSVS